MSQEQLAAAISEAEAALDDVPDSGEEGVKEDNEAFIALLDAVFALKRVAETDSGETEKLERVHADIVDAYTSVTDSDTDFVEADERETYIERIRAVQSSLDPEE